MPSWFQEESVDILSGRTRIRQGPNDARTPLAWGRRIWATARVSSTEGTCLGLLLAGAGSWLTR